MNAFIAIDRTNDKYVVAILKRIVKQLNLINELANRHYLSGISDSEELAKQLEIRYRQRPFADYIYAASVGYHTTNDVDKIMDILSIDKLVARHLIWDIHDTCFHTDFNSYYSCEKTSLKELELVISETIK